MSTTLPHIPPPCYTLLTLILLGLIIKNISLIFASISGNTEAVFDKVSEVLTAEKVTHNNSRSEETETSVIGENEYFILGTSTWDHGRINPKFDKLLEYITSNSMKGKKAAFIGLGDKMYEPVAFNAGMKTLREAFLKSGGTEIGQPLIIDGDPFVLMDSKIPYWTNKLIELLKNEK